jgi:hypothetical protein
MHIHVEDGEIEFAGLEQRRNFRIVLCQINFRADLTQQILEGKPDDRLVL